MNKSEKYNQFEMQTNDPSQSCSNEASNDYPHIVLNNFSCWVQIYIKHKRWIHWSLFVDETIGKKVK